MGVRSVFKASKERVRQVCSSLLCYKGKHEKLAADATEVHQDHDLLDKANEDGDVGRKQFGLVLPMTDSLFINRTEQVRSLPSDAVTTGQDSGAANTPSVVLPTEVPKDGIPRPCGSNTTALTGNHSLVCTKCWETFYAGPHILQPFISTSSIKFPTSLEELQSSATSCTMCRFFIESIQLRQKNTDNYLEIGSSSEEILLKVSTGTRSKFPNPETAWIAVHCNDDLRVGTFVVTSDDPTTVKYIHRTDINFNVGSDSSYQRAKTWLEECTERHKECPKYQAQPLPTRVLDVTPVGDSQHIRLYIPNGKVAAYTALSYCWGGPQPFSTQTSTLEARMNGIDINQLPYTIRDAITVTRGLGLQYLWIDAFCIIQDDDLDKQKEISRMGEIYQRAYCTIIAECAERASAGFLHQRREPPDCPQYRLPYIVPDGGVGTMLLRSQEAYGYDPLDEPLNARGWTLQERLLPPRQLLYTSQRLRWKCQTCEDVDGGLTFNMYDEPYLYSMMRVLDVASGKIPAPDLENGLIDPWDAWIFWKRVISEFSRRLCTDPADRVRAIGGIAKEFQRVWGPHSMYLAGHPECHLFESLAWYVDPFKMHSTRRGGYRAPSWSWMASEGMIWHKEEPKDSRRVVMVVECNATLASPFAPFGDISSGVLKVRGRVQGARWNLRGQGSYEIHFVDAVEFLDRPVAAGHVGSAFPDSVEDGAKEAVWGLVMSASRNTACGLVLDILDAGERLFRRVGYFEVAHPAGYALDITSSTEPDATLDKYPVVTIV